MIAVTLDRGIGTGKQVEPWPPTFLFPEIANQLELVTIGNQFLNSYTKKNCALLN